MSTESTHPVSLDEILDGVPDRGWATQNAAELLGITVNEDTWESDHWKIAENIFLVTKTPPKSDFENRDELINSLSQPLTPENIDNFKEG